MTEKLPTDPLADASTGVVRRSRGAFLKSTPAQPDRRDPKRRSRYTGPERRQEEPAPKAETPNRLLFGFPRWLVVTAGVYVAALLLAMVLIFTY
jgi:hypothetical protein